MFFRQIVSVLLLPVLLFASSGQEIFVHKCLVSGSTDVSLLPSDKCCGGKMTIPERRSNKGHELSKTKKKCCVYYSYSDQLSIVSFDDISLTSSVEAPVIAQSFFNGHLSFDLQFSDFSILDSSPPGAVAGRSLLYLHSVLRL